MLNMIWFVIRLGLNPILSNVLKHRNLLPAHKGTDNISISQLFYVDSL